MVAIVHGHHLGVHVLSVRSGYPFAETRPPLLLGVGFPLWR